MAVSATPVELSELASLRRSLADLIREHLVLRKAVLQLFEDWQGSGCPQLWIERNLLDLFTIFNIERSSSPEAELFPAEQRMYRIIADACDFRYAQAGLWEILQSILAGSSGLNASGPAARIKACLDRRYTQELRHPEHL